MDVKLVVADGGTKDQILRLRSEDVVVGRQKGCDVRIPSSSVSRRHCRLAYRDDFLSVEDLSSVNGTFVNGVRVKKTKVLRPGDKLQIGTILFLVKYKLSKEARASLLEKEKEENELDFDVVDVEEVVEVEGVDEQDLDEAIPMDGDDTRSTVEVAVAKKESVAKRKKEKTKQRVEEKKKEKEKDEDSPDASLLLSKPWNVEAGEDLRDILSRLEKEE